jgi:hypothetical protein
MTKLTKLRKGRGEFLRGKSGRRAGRLEFGPRSAAVALRREVFPQKFALLPAHFTFQLGSIVRDP